ncbi:MAG: oxidoreductase [Pedobacter sp.]|nr:MAG: oxidoreductase [Pedobacter sp.]
MKLSAIILLLILSLSKSLKAQHFELKLLSTDKNSGLRGLSVVDNKTAWVSGSNGQVGKTLDAGQSWIWVSPPGFEKLDFRDIEAFDDKRAVIVNAGSPAYILKTENGGESWEQVYINTSPDIFLDGMEFWDENNGIIFGDPINNKMPLLITHDGGKNWESISHQLNFEFSEGEAGFAASGTSIRMQSKGHVWIGTGGKVSNIYYSKNYGKSWTKYPCPIWQGENSTGIFSLAFASAKKGIVVGGNYLKDKENPNNILLTKNGGKTWFKPVVPVNGYRSAVEYIGNKIWVSTGSSGTDYSIDDGMTWVNISKQNFNTIKKAKNGNLILLTGPNGRISQLIKKN